jgi:hypothetical protein
MKPRLTGALFVVLFLSMLAIFMVTPAGCTAEQLDTITQQKATADTVLAGLQQAVSDLQRQADAMSKAAATQPADSALAKATADIAAKLEQTEKALKVAQDTSATLGTMIQQLKAGQVTAPDLTGVPYGSAIGLGLMAAAAIYKGIQASKRGATAKDLMEKLATVVFSVQQAFADPKTGELPAEAKAKLAAIQGPDVSAAVDQIKSQTGL